MLAVIEAQKQLNGRLWLLTRIVRWPRPTRLPHGLSQATMFCRWLRIPLGVQSTCDVEDAGYVTSQGLRLYAEWIPRPPRTVVFLQERQ